MKTLLTLSLKITFQLAILLMLIPNAYSQSNGESESQSTSVEKSTFGLQTGVLGLWAYNEAKLSNNIALRTEVGLDFGIWETTYYDDYDSPFLQTPVVVLEPRLYYNLKNAQRIPKEQMGIVEILLL